MRSWNNDIPLGEVRNQGFYVLDQDTDFIIAAITGTWSAVAGFHFLATSREIGNFLVVITSLADEDRYRFQDPFTIMQMNRKPYLRQQDNGG